MANQLVVDLTNSINAASIVSGANLAGQSVQHYHHVGSKQYEGTNVVARNEIIYCAYKNSQILAAWVTPESVPASGTSVTVDLQSYIVGTGWTSVLSGTLTLSSTLTAYTPLALSVSSANLVPAVASTNSASLLRTVVTVTGAGTQVQGLSIDVVINENGT